VKVKVEMFKSPTLPGMLMIDESIRRLKDMTRFTTSSKDDNPWTDEHTLVINQNNPAIKNLIQLAKGFNKDEDIKMTVDHIYDLAFLQQGKFTADMMQVFVDRSTRILEKIGH
jgi:HSP90 family molecular chaperone